MTSAFLMTLCRYFQLYAVCPGSPLNFFTGGLDLLVGKDGGTKNEIGVQVFLTPRSILIKFHSNETLQCFLGAHERRQSTANMPRYFLQMYLFTD